MDNFVVEQIKGHVSTIHVIRSWVTVIYCYTVLLFIVLFTLNLINRMAAEWLSG